jgi:NAD(P)-dependent dehydrogenase (short-subunit alcohol dehydrogenase family)
MHAGSFLVTGASTGIGRACVDRLVRTGARVWATVRSESDEHALRKAHGDKVSVLRVDITDTTAVAEAGGKVCAAGPLNGVLNNAGIAVPAPLEHLPVDAFRRQLEVNVVGQLAVTQAVLPALRAARAAGQQATIVMVGSIGGRIAGPILGAYHVSKFALVGLSDSLRAELAPSGIKVVLVEPGPVATPIWHRGEVMGDDLMESLPEGALTTYRKQIEAMRANAHASAKRGLPPERAAAIIVKAMTALDPRPRILIGPQAHVASLVARLPFRLRYRLTAARQ